MKLAKGNNGRILVTEAEIETETFILINLCNSNSETGQLQTLSDADLLFPEFSLDVTNVIVIAGDFNLILNQNLEVLGGIQY